jgi:hypothetical protein
MFLDYRAFQLLLSFHFLLLLTNKTVLHLEEFRTPMSPRLGVGVSYIDADCI